MDASIVSALISAGASIAMFFAGTLSGKSSVLGKYREEIYKVQIHSIFEPLMKSADGDTFHIDEIEAVVTNNYSLVPQAIFKEYQTLKLQDEPDFANFKAMLVSYYNWTKKQIGYPYDKRSISSIYFPSITWVPVTIAVLFTFICIFMSMRTVSKSLLGENFAMEFSIALYSLVPVVICHAVIKRLKRQ